MFCFNYKFSHKFLFFIFTLFVGSFFIYLQKVFYPRSAKSTVIIINGPSGSGKSSLQKQVQVVMKEPFLAVGLDSFFVKVLPMNFVLNEKPKGDFDAKEFCYVEFNKDLDGNSVVPLYIGARGVKVIDGMHNAIKAYADAGNNVVVDYILYDKSWPAKLNNLLKNHKVVWVGTNISLEVLEAREKTRGTSPVGHARSHYESVHDEVRYDLVVDTMNNSPRDCAMIVKKFLEF